MLSIAQQPDCKMEQVHPGLFCHSQGHRLQSNSKALRGSNKQLERGESELSKLCLRPGLQAFGKAHGLEALQREVQLLLLQHATSSVPPLERSFAEAPVVPRTSQIFPVPVNSKQ